MIFLSKGKIDSKLLREAAWGWAEGEGRKQHMGGGSDLDFDPVSVQILNILGFVVYGVSVTPTLVVQSQS